MKLLRYSVIIEAPRERVWETALADETYRHWMRVFAPGTYMKGRWEEGAHVHFLAPNEDGTESGTVGIVVHYRHPVYVAIKHVGYYEGDIEDSTKEQVKLFIPTHERYTLTESGESGTEFSVEVEARDEYADFLGETWPVALSELKQLCEGETVLSF